MATERQIEANRQNALKSTGPTSPAGKTASSKNSWKHGLRAEQNVFLDEDKDEYGALIDELFDQLRPVGILEEHLVWRIANRMWQQRRVPKIEAGIVASGASWRKAAIEQSRKDAAERTYPPSKPDTSPIPPISVSAAFLQLAGTGKISLLALMARYSNDADRAFLRDLRELERLQTERKKTSTKKTPTKKTPTKKTPTKKTPTKKTSTSRNETTQSD